MEHPRFAVQAEYQDLVANDAAAINCDLPRDGSGKIHVFDPAFPAGFDLGDPVQISLSCNFHVLTPIISNILGGVIAVSASTTYPVRQGAVAEVPGGGGPILVAPVADFVGSPQAGFGQTAAPGYGTLDVTFTDTSQGSPTSWEWSFGNGTGLVYTKGPHTAHYACNKLPGETCLFTVRLTVGSAGGIDTQTKTDYIVVTVPPSSGPVAEFTASPRSGTNPLAVQFTFVDKRLGTVSYSSYVWSFGDGTPDGTGQTVSHSYATPGAYTVSLRVTENGTGATSIQTKTAYVLVSKKICIVPDFAKRHVNDAQGIWDTAGFKTTVQFAAGNGNYTIHTQSMVGGTIDPQPDGCGSTIMVGP